MNVCGFNLSSTTRYLPVCYYLAVAGVHSSLGRQSVFASKKHMISVITYHTTCGSSHFCRLQSVSRWAGSEQFEFAHGCFNSSADSSSSLSTFSVPSFFKCAFILGRWCLSTVRLTAVLLRCVRTLWLRNLALETSLFLQISAKVLVCGLVKLVPAEAYHLNQLAYKILASKYMYKFQAQYMCGCWRKF